MEFEQHELSAVYPAMSADEFKKLKSDIRENGQIEQGSVKGKRVVDGWHRYQACEELSIEFSYKQLPLSVDLVAFVRSKNEHRRHLTNGQLAAIEIKLQRYSEVAVDSGRIDRGDTANPYEQEKSGARAPECNESVTDGSVYAASNAQMAENAGVPIDSIKRARQAERLGRLDDVIDGKVSVTEASKPVGATEPPPKPKTTTELDKLKTLVEQLQSQVSELFQQNEELQIEVKADGSARNEDIYDEVKHGLSVLHVVEQRRDQLLNENSLLKREVKRLQRKLEIEQ